MEDELVVAPKLIDTRFADKDRRVATGPITKPKTSVEADLHALLSNEEQRAEVIAMLRRVANAHRLEVVDLKANESKGGAHCTQCGGAQRYYDAASA